MYIGDTTLVRSTQHNGRERGRLKVEAHNAGEEHSVITLSWKRIHYDVIVS